jgi:transcriptional regulator of acetoin/glycerol metabolism
MTQSGQHTTEREQSHAEAGRRSFILRWIWPEARFDSVRGATVLLGRDDKAQIRLSGSGVSRRHAEVYRQGPLYVIRDLGSTNGTWLGGKLVEHVPLYAGAVIRIGNCVGIFEESADEQGFRELLPGLWGGGVLALAVQSLSAGARSTLPILLVGATGTGKERLARAAHELSGRAGPFVALNCAAMPEHLAEAELFGYRRGAFTGAERGSLGYFRAAHGGTLFLDEMPELSSSIQAKLLRVVEDGQIAGLGESTGSRVDVRLIVSSQEMLRGLVAAGRLRRDLAARFAGIEVRLPTLAERRSDIVPLFAHFLKIYSGGRPPLVEARLVEALSLYDWPENVRELELLVRRLLALYGLEPQLRRRHLPEDVSKLVDELGALGINPSALRERREYELDRVKTALADNGGNVQAAAAALGISRQRIYRLLQAKDTAEGRNDVAGN